MCRWEGKGLGQTEKRVEDLISIMYSRCQTNKKLTRPLLCLATNSKDPIKGRLPNPTSGPIRGIDSTRLNRPAASKVLPWQQDGNGDHNVFMVPATWGLPSCLSGD